MTKLEILYASDECGIGDNGLIGINLKELYVSGNSKIVNCLRNVC